MTRRRPIWVSRSGAQPNATRAATIVGLGGGESGPCYRLPSLAGQAVASGSIRRAREDVTAKGLPPE